MTNILHYGVGQNPGGIESYILKIYQNIDRNRYRFSILAETEGQLAYEDEYRDMGAEIFRATPRRHSPSQNREDVRKLFCNNRFDVFHCHLNTLSYVTPIAIAQRHNCPVLLHSRNAGCKQMHTRILHHLHKYTVNWRSLKCVAVSDKAGQWLFGNRPYTVLNNGIDTQRFAFCQDSRVRLRESFAQNDETLLIHVGAFTPAKNHLFLIDIYEAYLKLDPKSSLLLVGGGDADRRKTEEYVRQKGLSEKVRFLGVRADIPDLLCAADVFVFPSLFEGFPNAVLEAETTGLFCVLSDVISGEVCVEGQTVSLSLEDSPDTWAKAIEQALSQRIDRGKSALKVRESGLSVEAEIERLCGAYDNLAEWR